MMFQLQILKVFCEYLLFSDISHFASGQIQIGINGLFIVFIYFWQSKQRDKGYVKKKRKKRIDKRQREYKNEFEVKTNADTNENK